MKPQGELDHAYMLKIGLRYDGKFKNELKIMSNLLTNINYVGMSTVLFEFSLIKPILSILIITFAFFVVSFICAVL